MSRLLTTSKKISARTAVTAVLAAGIGLVWLVSMVLMTWISAQEIVNQLRTKSDDFNGRYGEVECGMLDALVTEGDAEYERGQEDPAYFNYTLHETAARGNSTYLPVEQEYEWYARLKQNPLVECRTAALIYDKDGKRLCKNGNYVYFRYITEEKWQESIDEYGDNYGYFYINEKDGALYPELADFYPEKYFKTKSEIMSDVIRIVGTADENGELVPYRISYVTRESVDKLLTELGHIENYSGRPELESYHQAGSTIMVHAHYSFGNMVDYSMMDWDREGKLEWIDVMNHTEEAETPDELITVYAQRPEFSIYDESPITYYYKEFDNLADLTHKVYKGRTDLLTTGRKGTRSSGDIIRLNNGSVYSLNGTFIFSDRTFNDVSYDINGGVTYNTDVELTLVTAIYCHPLKAAAEALIRVYIITAVAALIAVIVMRKVIIRNIIGPVNAVNRSIEEGWKPVYFDDRAMDWQETDEFYRNYRDQREYRRTSQNEITRLSTALDYAKEAEENRRQLTSSIAHELKTPLAIVRSYAEGLQEHIAEEKRDKYLEIIISETDRMDAMVLEMLDLSRLEAGKVKLAQDDFSLAQMVHDTFEKFETLAAEKELKISLDMKGDLPVTADEARLGQVVTNFVSNAVRYTPHGGEIRVRAYQRSRKTLFFIENTGKHFTEEEKQKIWETFYRTDKSRSSKGTGLGLAIAKNIVELHGGKVFVYNTELGVQFGFEI